jgi:hypothetical protein
MTDQSGPGATGQPYGAQPPYMAQPPYGQARPPYGETQPPQAARPPHGQRPAAGGQPGPRRRRRGLWLGAGGAAVVIIAAVVVVAVTTGKGSAPPPPSPTGPLACDVPGNPVSGSGQWTLVTPPTVCGLPKYNTAEMQQANQEALGSLEELLSAAGLVGASPGQYKSSFTQAFIGLKGTFHTGPALAALESTGSQLESPFRSVPAGPHGGAMGCAVVTTGTWQCVWATTTTLGQFTLSDTSGELAGSHLAANAVRIRDVLEESA